jgi:hypothetical protein
LNRFVIFHVVAHLTLLSYRVILLGLPTQHSPVRIMPAAVAHRNVGPSSGHREPEYPTNRPDEWEIEQGLHGSSLPLLDQSGEDFRYVKPFEYKPWKDDAAIRSVGNADELFREDRDGWEGYIEWEDRPDRKEKAHKILTSQNVGMLTGGLKSLCEC